MIFNKPLGLWHLVEKDLYIWREQKKDYGAVAERARGKNVLDFGAHMGFFNKFICEAAPPRHIVSVEPDPRAGPLLSRNCRDDTAIINAAVVDEFYPNPTVDLYFGTRMSKNSVEPFRGRKITAVPVVKFQRLIHEHYIQFIKCDCEGAEYLLDWGNLPRWVETIAIEFHFHRPKWEEDMWVINDTLLNQGFKAFTPPKINTFFKVANGHYIRNRKVRIES